MFQPPPDHGMPRASPDWWISYGCGDTGGDVHATHGGDMKRRIAAAALVVGLSGMAASGTAGAQDDTVTLTIGLIQDMSSPNVTVGYLVPEFDVWNLQYATLTDKAADDFATIPGLAESWEESNDGLTYTYTLREGLQWSDGNAVHRRGHRLHDQPLARRGVVQPLLDHARTSTPSRSTTAPSRSRSSVPDPKLPTMDVYIVPKHIYEPLDAEAILEYDAMDGVASGPYSLTEWRSGQDWTMVKQPELVRARQRHRPHRLPRVHQRRRDGRGAAAG